MNNLFCACILLVVASTAVADHDHDHSIKFCTSDVTKCKTVPTNFTCQAKMGDSCTKDVVDGKADLTLATADHLVKYMDELKVVYGQKLKDLGDFVHYYGLAVVQKDASFNLTDLKGKKSCHTGVDKTVGWKIPVGYLLYTREMPYIDNQYKSVADYFGESCAPGINAKSVSDDVKEDLCKLCNGSCAQNSTTERYQNYAGAFICMAEGDNDRVGFVRQSTPKEVFDKYGNKYGSASNYQLLCKDGTKKDLNKYKECNIEARPAYALVAKKSVSDEHLKSMQDLLDAYSLDDLVKNGMATKGVEKLKPYDKTLEMYVGEYGNYINALTGNTPTPTPTLTASSITISLALQIIAAFALVLLS